MEISVSIVSVIQSMLAPGLMISACGLLLLGMNNKYSLVVNRIRLLNEEKRRFKLKAEEKEFTYHEEVRLKSITVQLERFKFRVKLVRNAVFFYSLAVALFVITSLFIGLGFTLKEMKFEILILLFFSLGMISVLARVTFAAYETIKGYQIVSFEVKADE